MQIPITLPDDQVAKWLEAQGWTEEHGCAYEAQAYMDRVAERTREIRQENAAAHEVDKGVPLLTTREAIAAAQAEIGEYKPCTAEAMVTWGIEHLFAAQAVHHIREREGSQGIEAVRDSEDYKSVFQPPTFEVKAK